MAEKRRLTKAQAERLTNSLRNLGFQISSAHWELVHVRRLMVRLCEEYGIDTATPEDTSDSPSREGS